MGDKPVSPQAPLLRRPGSTLRV